MLCIKCLQVFTIKFLFLSTSYQFKGLWESESVLSYNRVSQLHHGGIGTSYITRMVIGPSDSLARWVSCAANQMTWAAGSTVPVSLHWRCLAEESWSR